MPRCGASLLRAVACLFGPSLLFCQPDNNLVYQIFVRSFADTPADTATGGSGEAGDLRGLRENLDYLNDGKPATDTDLEVGVLWLSPIFPTTTYHGYDILDYRGVNAEFGTMRDLRELAAAAHRRGMRVILDLPVNHTSNRHPWFRKAVDDPTSRYRKFYQFSDADKPAPPGTWHVATSASGRKVRYLGVFGANMPDLDFDEPAVRREVKAIARFWIRQGVDGFRLDAAKHIYGNSLQDVSDSVIARNNQWWREFSDFVYSVKRNALLVGEVLGDPEVLCRHAAGLDALVDEPFLRSARSRIAFPSANFVTQWTGVVKRCREVHTQAGGKRPFATFAYLASHDENPRLASYLEDMRQKGMQATVDEAYRLGMYLLTSLGTYAILYNGDELMQPGYKWRGNPPNHASDPGDGSRIYDETLREPFPWFKSGAKPPQTGWFASRFDKPNDGISVEEENGSGSMLELVRALTNLRTEHPSYANGDVATILNDSPEWMVFEKGTQRERYLVLINSTGSGREYTFHSGWHPEYAAAELLFWSDGQRKQWRNESKSGRRIEASVLVPPWGMVLLRGRALR